MDEHYTNIPWVCHDEKYNLAHLANDILTKEVFAFRKDDAGKLIPFEPEWRGLRGGIVDIINMMDRGELYFDKAILMMVHRNYYKSKLLELEPRIEEKDALIEKLKNRVARLERYVADEEKRMADLLASFGLSFESSPAVTAQEALPSTSQAEPVKRGESGRQKANLDRLKEWQTVFLPAMIKAAVALGGAGPQTEGNPRQRKDVQVELDKHLAGKKAPKTVLDMLYKALPDEYVDRKGGNTPTKPKTPPQV